MIPFHGPIHPARLSYQKNAGFMFHYMGTSMSLTRPHIGIKCIEEYLLIVFKGSCALFKWPTHLWDVRGALVVEKWHIHDNLVYLFKGMNILECYSLEEGVLQWRFLLRGPVMHFYKQCVYGIEEGPYIYEFDLTTQLVLQRRSTHSKLSFASNDWLFTDHHECYQVPGLEMHYMQMKPPTWCTPRHVLFHEGEYIVRVGLYDYGGLLHKCPNDECIAKYHARKPIKLWKGCILSICPRGRRIVTYKNEIIGIYGPERRALFTLLCRFPKDVCQVIKTHIIP